MGIVTRDRPRSLAACLSSYAANCERYGRSPEFVVADDSNSAESAERARAAVQAIAGPCQARLRYAGVAEKRGFAERLAAESGVPPELIGFALAGDQRCTISTGANRNSLLLDTVGKLTLAVDDDTVAKIATLPGHDSAASSFPGFDPTEFWFFQDHDSALGALSRLDIDLLGCHEGLLGSESAAGGHVVMTLHGLVGDSGMASPRHYLTLTGGSRERLVASPESYRSAFRSREVVRTVRRPTIVRGSFCMSTFLGLDQRRLLPPFFPVQRNSDGIFGQTLYKCLDRAHTAFLPWTLLHSPDPPRRFSPEDLWGAAARLRMSDLVIAAILGKESPAEAATTAARLIDLGKHLEWLGGLNAVDFEDQLRAVQEYRNFGLMTTLHGQLQTYGRAPAYWAEDVERMIELTSQAPRAEDYLAPADLPRGLDAADTIRLAQELIRKYGALLQAWPALFDAAARLAQQGRRLSAPLRH